MIFMNFDVSKLEISFQNFNIKNGLGEINLNFDRKNQKENNLDFPFKKNTTLYI